MGGIGSGVRGFGVGTAKNLVRRLLAERSHISSVPDHAAGSYDPYPDWQPVLRDVGLQSRTLREALEVLAEAAPTMPGLNLYLDSHGFRSITQSLRDLNDNTRLNILQRAEWMGIANALAARGMQIRTDLIVSEGFTVEATSEDDEFASRIQRVLDDHWELNEWEDRLFERVFDLGITGEMIRRVPPLTRMMRNGEVFKLGRFKAGMILPHLVQKITIDPWNYESLDTVILQQYAYPIGTNLRMKIMRENCLGLYNEIEGDCLYASVNRRPGASRGLSDLTPALEWLDLHDQSLFNDCERAAVMMKFIWDVTLVNANQPTIQKYMAELKANPIKSGAVRVHSDKEIWDAIAPDLKIGDTSQLREDIFLLAWGAMGLPRHWFVEAENVNRASAEEMVSPVFAWARTRRRMIQRFLELEHKYAIQVARESGRLQGVPISEQGIHVIGRDPDRSSYEAMSNSLTNLAQGLVALTSAGLMDAQPAADIVRNFCGSFGFELPETIVKDPEQAQQGQPMVDPNTGQPVPQIPQTAGENPLQTVLSEAWDKLERNRSAHSKLRYNDGRITETVRRKRNLVPVRGKGTARTTRGTPPMRRAR